MSLKNETSETIVVSVAALFIIGWLGSASWWFFHNVDFKRASREPNSPSQTKATTKTAQPNPTQPAANVAPVPQPVTTIETFAKVPNVPSGQFKYSGGALWEPIRYTVNRDIQKTWRSFQLSYTQPTSSGQVTSDTGIDMLLNNELAFTLSSRPLKSEEYQQASQTGFTIKEIPVASSGVAVAVYPKLKIPGLTLAQLKDIYTGKVMNWKEVGGPDLLITVYSGKKGDGGPVDLFVEKVLGGENLGANIQYVSSTRDAFRQLASNTGGIYYASAPEVVRRCDVKALPIGLQANTWVAPYKEPAVPIEQCPPQRNQVNPEVFTSGKYPISRRFSVVIKENGQGDQRAGTAYSQLLLTKQAQDLITNAGFMGVR